MSTLAELDERQHAATVKAAVTALLGSWSAYDYDEVPGSALNASEAARNQRTPAIYVLVSVERRPNLNRRASGHTVTSGWRLTVRAVGTTVDEARWALSKATAALNERSLTIAGRPTTLLQFESGTAPEPDDGRYSASATWTYAL